MYVVQAQREMCNVKNALRRKVIEVCVEGENVMRERGGERGREGERETGNNKGGEQGERVCV